MKKFFAILFTAMLLLAGCAKVEDMTIGNFGRSEITFNTGTSVATKAIVDTTAMEDNFGVYGYVVPGEFSVNGGYLMKNAEYDKDGNAVGGPYYWPKSDNYTGIDFIFTAYSQYDNTVEWVNDTLKLNIPALTQSLIDDPDGFDDVLWAQTAYNHHQNGAVGAEHERVELTFRHALSWLQFRGEVINPNIKWVRVKQISFGEYRDSIPGVAAVPEVPAYDDTTDTWVNLKKTYSAVASATKLRVKEGDTWGAYTNAAPLPDALVAEIKSYYTVDNGAAGDYDLHMGNTVWASNVIKQLRKTDKAIPAEYDLAVEMTGGEIMHFFNGWKYLQDNGYDIQPANSGGKPDVWDYVLIDAFVNGAAYTVVGLNCWDSNAAPQHTIEHHDAVPGVAAVPAVPASGSEGVYVDGWFRLPTASLLTDTPAAMYGTQKDTTLNYVSAQTDTLFTGDHVVLGNSLVIPQPVPQNITVVFDICIANPSGDDVVFTDRKITRTINTGKDADQDADYVASWGASNKYIYNFRFDGDVVNFNALVSGWTLSGTDYHVWDY
jgi:hypothetical protein